MEGKEIKELKVFVIQNEQIDPDSYAVTLDFDGIANVPTVKKLVEERLKAGNQVTWKDVGVVCLGIYAENKRRRRANK